MLATDGGFLLKQVTKFSYDTYTTLERKKQFLAPNLGTSTVSCYFQSADVPTKPRETIQKISSTYPNDQKSPFFGVEMKPLARLYLTRQRLYEKSCSDDTTGGAPDDDSGLDENVGSGGMLLLAFQPLFY